MKNLALFFTAFFLFLPLSFINYLYVVWIKDKSSKGYFRTSAVNIDRFGNQELKGILNYSLRKTGGYDFGDYRETISSALGKNQKAGTLTKTGKVLAKILDTIDKRHCVNSIKEL